MICGSGRFALKTFDILEYGKKSKPEDMGTRLCILFPSYPPCCQGFAICHFLRFHLLDQDLLAQVRRFVLHSCLSQEPKELEKAGVASPGRGQIRNYARYRCRGSTSLISERSNMPHLPSTCPQCPTTYKVPAKAYCIKYSTPGPDKAVSPRELH